MTKRIVALLLCLAMALSLAACGDNTPDPTTPPTDPTVPSTEKPTDAPTDPTDAPTDPVVVMDVQKVYDDCIALMGEMIPLEADMMLDFCGILPEDCEKAFVAISADGLLTDEIWVIQAVNEEAVQRLLDKVTKRLKAKAEESETYSPVQYAVVQKAVTIQEGNYVILLVAPNVDELKAVVDTALGK